MKGGAEQAWITDRQRALWPLPLTARTRTDYLRYARWLHLEARRGYESAAATARYARNMRWAAELAREYGPGTWLELIARAGVKNPEAKS